MPEDDQSEATPLTRAERDDLIVKLTRPVRLTAKGEIDKNDLARQTIRDAILLILFTGIRRQECVNLEWVNWNRPWLHVKGTKTDDADRKIPITDQTVLDMLDRRSQYGDRWIFTTRRGTPLPPTALLKFMKRETGHTVHELRHTFITEAARAGVNPKVLQTISGHRDLETMLKVNTHVSEEDKLNAVQIITAYCNATATEIPEETD